jgi:hypothetical protein
MVKVTKFFKGDPASAKLFGPIKEADLKALTDEEKKEWLKKRDAARKNPPPYAIVQKPEVYK